MNQLVESRVFAFQRTDDRQAIESFLVAPTIDHTWSLLPTAPSASQSRAFYTVDSRGSASRFEMAEVDKTTEAAITSEYMWVSLQGLRSVLEYDGRDVHAALNYIDKTEPVLPATSKGFESDVWSVLIVKPDAQEQGLRPDILDMVDEASLTVMATAENIQLTAQDVERIWTPPTRWHIPQAPGAWWYATSAYMQEAPVAAYLIYGEQASKVLGSIKQTLRLRYDSNPHDREHVTIAERVRSLMHCSDRTEELLRNAALFWSIAELRNVVMETQE